MVGHVFDIHYSKKCEYNGGIMIAIGRAYTTRQIQEEKIRRQHREYYANECPY